MINPPESCPYYTTTISLYDTPVACRFGVAENGHAPAKNAQRYLYFRGYWACLNANGDESVVYLLSDEVVCCMLSLNVCIGLTWFAEVTAIMADAVRLISYPVQVDDDNVFGNDGEDCGDYTSPPCHHRSSLSEWFHETWILRRLQLSVDTMFADQEEEMSVGMKKVEREEGKERGMGENGLDGVVIMAVWSKTTVVVVDDEMLRLQRLGSNTEMGVPYTEEEIMAIIQKGKQRGHLPDVDRVLPRRATDGCAHLPQSTVDPADVEMLKKSNKSLTKHVKMMMRLFRSDDKFSQVLNQYESSPEFGNANESGGCGDDEPGGDEDGDEDEEDVDS
ncbi:hypothetical protein Tco_0696360 [Tanacetum coccineum]